MRRFLSILITATLLLGAQSCENIDVVKNTSIRCVTCGYNEGGVSTLAEWNKGEQICLYRAENWAPALLSLASGAGSSTATFNGNTAGTKAGYYAIRPATAAGAIRDNSVIAINVEPTNIFFASENSATAVPQIGKGNADGITFTSIFGALKFNIEGINSISSVQVSVPGNERGVCGTFQYRLIEESLYGEDVEYEAERICSPAMDISSDKVIYVALPQGGYKSAHQAPSLVADVGGGIDGDGAGGGLRDGRHVQKLLLLQPAPLGDEFVFQQGDHGVAAAEGEETDLEHGPEQLQVGFALHVTPPAFPRSRCHPRSRSVQRSPSTARTPALSGRRRRTTYSCSRTPRHRRGRWRGRQAGRPAFR